MPVVKCSDSFLATLFDELTLPTLLLGHEIGVLVSDVVLGSQGWAELVVGSESHLCCSDVEVGDVDWIVGWFDLVVPGVVGQAQDADATGFVGGSSLIPDSAELEVAERV